MTAVPLALVLTVVHADALRPGNHTRTVEVGGRKRTYHVHVPRSYDPKKPAPVVLAFHGALTNGLMMKFFCGLDATSDKHGFLAVYPNGTGSNRTNLVWNSGGFKGKGLSPADDVAFVAALLDDLARVATLDRKRVYATGISNGAMMSYRLGAELSDRIAAIAPVAGLLAVPRFEPKRPVSVLHFHGTRDTFVPFGSVENSIMAWVKADGCSTRPTTTEVADGKKDGLKVVRKVYGGGKDGTEVVLYVIEGGGHTWPGRKAPLKFLGKSTEAISANELMWQFFRKHPQK